ncbi:MAG: hypothetical protein Q8K75_01640 [Chlamydiales bacterium]|nr:hypothetical protein [Chlamydiales bacterium]
MTVFAKLVGDLDFEHMVAEIFYEVNPNTHRTVARITMEEGVEKMKIQMFACERELSLDQLIAALAEAKEALLECK